MIASEAYAAITKETERRMHLCLQLGPAGADFRAGMVSGNLLGLFQGWEIAGAALMGWGDEVFCADQPRLYRLSLGEVS